MITVVVFAAITCDITTHAHKDVFLAAWLVVRADVHAW